MVMGTLGNLVFLTPQAFSEQAKNEQQPENTNLETLDEKGAGETGFPV